MNQPVKFLEVNTAIEEMIHENGFEPLLFGSIVPFLKNSLAFKIFFMKQIGFFLVTALFFHGTSLQAQQIKLEKGRLLPSKVFMSVEKLDGKEAIRAVKDSAVKQADEPTFVKIRDVNFHNGTIEVKVLSRLTKDAPEFARGFIGVAFRINEDNTKFECIYIRPVNARVEDQVRRNHSIQYYSYPDYKFDRLRKESPEKYEAYTDMEMNKWITMRIEVKGSQAKLFIDNNKQPSLIVNDLKHGPDLSGGIGFWVETGTEGFFRDLKVSVN